MLLNRFVFLLLFFISTFSLMGKSYYFRDIRINPYGGYTPIMGLDPEIISSISHYSVDFDNQGRIVKIKHIINSKERTRSVIGVPVIEVVYQDDYVDYIFKNNVGLPQSNDEGIYSIRLQMDDTGFPKTIFFYNKFKNIIADQFGVSSYLQQYNAESSTLQSYGFDKQGSPVLFMGNVNSILRKLDDSGNVIEEYYLGKDDALVDNDLGVAAIKMSYNDDLLVRSDRFDIEGDLVNSLDGYATEIVIYNDYNRIAEKQYYDETGSATGNVYGISRYLWHYDGEGNKIGQENLNASDQLTFDEHSVAKYRWVYYDQGKELVQYNYNKLAELDLDDNGIAIYRWRYNDLNQVIEDFYYGPEETPQLNIWGVFRHTYAYDKSGNKIEQNNFDTNFKPVLDSKLVARYVWSYDYFNNKIEQKNYGTDSKLILDNNGIAKYTWEYDQWNEPIVAINYGLLGQRKNDRNGVAEYRWDYNSNGSVVQIRNFGIGRELIEDNNGIAITQWHYNSTGIPLDVVYYNKQRQPKE